MYLAIRRIRTKPGTMDEAIRKLENEFVPLVSSVPGFVEYYAVQVGEDVGVTVSVFESQEAAEESNRRSADWVKQSVAPLAAGPLEIVAGGEVRVRKAK